MSLLTAVMALLLMALLFGAVLGFAAIIFKVEGNPIVEQIDSILPQTQCGQCGHPGCHPYAESIANGEDHNRCPPGGEQVVEELSNLLGRDVLPLDVDEDAQVDVPMVAYIREDECIGCTKCIQACPMDAILGAARLMHTVIVDECTGCDLCVEPCPVDCIDMLPLPVTHANWAWSKPQGVGLRSHNLIPLENI